MALPFHVLAVSVWAGTAVTPESMTATTTAASLPAEMSHAAGIRSCCRFHCRENDGSFGVACSDPR